MSFRIGLLETVSLSIQKLIKPDQQLILHLFTPMRPLQEYKQLKLKINKLSGYNII